VTALITDLYLEESLTGQRHARGADQFDKVLEMEQQ
jgi:hypothetical protein